MNRKQKLILLALALLPFITALSFRAVDNYQFQLNQQKKRKSRSTYFPKTIPGTTEEQLKEEFTCHYAEWEKDTVYSDVSELP